MNYIAIINSENYLTSFAPGRSMQTFMQSGDKPYLISSENEKHEILSHFNKFATKYDIAFISEEEFVIKRIIE